MVANLAWRLWHSGRTSALEEAYNVDPPNGEWIRADWKGNSVTLCNSPSIQDTSGRWWAAGMGRNGLPSFVCLPDDVKLQSWRWINGEAPENYRRRIADLERALAEIVDRPDDARKIANAALGG